MPDVEIELDWRGRRYKNVERGLDAIGTDLEKDFEKMTPLIKNILIDYMEGVVMSVADRARTPYPGGTSPAGRFPGTLSKRSGKLLASLSKDRIKVAGGMRSEVAVSYTLTGIATVHERGATIRPKRAKYLTVPLPPALTSRGIPKKKSARDWRNTFVLKSKKGNLLIVQKRADGGITPLYVLKKSVTIPKRLAFGEAFNAGRDFLADKIASDVIREFFT